MKLLKALPVLLLTASAVTFMAAPSVQAEPTPIVSPTTTPAAKPKAGPFRGLVSAVDEKEKSFTLTSKAGNVRTFLVGSDVKIINGDQPAQLSDLKVDTAVRGSAIKLDSGKFQVVKLAIGEKPKASPSPKK